MFINFFWYWLIVFCVTLTLVCSLKVFHMRLTRNHMFIREILGKLTSFIFLNFEISRVKRGDFTQEISKFQKSELGKLIPNFTLKHVITSTKMFFISEWSFLLSSNVRIKIRAGIWKILLHQCRDPGLNKSELHANITTMLWSNDNALLVWHIAPSALTSHSVYRIYINSWMTYVCNKVLRNLIVSSNFESLPVGALRPSM